MQRGVAPEKVPENTQNYNWKGVPYKNDNARCVLRGGSPWKDRGPAATAGLSGGGGSSWRSGTEDIGTRIAAYPATNMSVS
jgi:hypothetical protein